MSHPLDAVVTNISRRIIGMFFLVMEKCAATDKLMKLMHALGMYLVAIIIGQFVHMFVFYPLLFRYVTRGAYGTAYHYWWRIREAPMVAFATASSAASDGPTRRPCARPSSSSDRLRT